MRQRRILQCKITLPSRKQYGETAVQNRTTHCVFFYAENKIDGESFLELSEEDIKTMVKPLGIVKKILRLQKPLLPVSTTVRNNCGFLMDKQYRTGLLFKNSSAWYNPLIVVFMH